MCKIVLMSRPNYVLSEKQFFDCVPFCHHRYIKNKKYLSYAVLYYFCLVWLVLKRNEPFKTKNGCHFEICGLWPLIFLNLRPCLKCNPLMLSAVLPYMDLMDKYITKIVKYNNSKLHLQTTNLKLVSICFLGSIFKQFDLIFCYAFLLDLVQFGWQY